MCCSCFNNYHILKEAIWFRDVKGIVFASFTVIFSLESPFEATETKNICTDFIQIYCIMKYLIDIYAEEIVVNT